MLVGLGYKQMRRRKEKERVWNSNTFIDTVENY
jgi:hypothetical protein